MGLFDSIKSTFGKGSQAADVTKAPSEVLREAGLDPSGLKFNFGNQSIAVSGTVAAESDRQRILDVLAELPGIDSVQDQMTVAAEPAPRTAEAGPEAPAAAAEQAEPAAAGVRTYTVASGDTLWNISEQMYGKGSHYMKIFEANTDVLENPDRIFPGQELRIPDL
jgi:nucleoid-associated protein YgaU